MGVDYVGGRDLRHLDHQHEPKPLIEYDLVNVPDLINCYSLSITIYNYNIRVFIIRLLNN